MGKADGWETGAGRRGQQWEVTACVLTGSPGDGEVRNKNKQKERKHLFNTEENSNYRGNKRHKT